MITTQIKTGGRVKKGLCLIYIICFESHMVVNPIDIFFLTWRIYHLGPACQYM